MKPQIIIISGISASGKTTIQREMTKNGYHKVITSTTRKPRIEEGEKHGVDYNFYNIEEFLNKKENNDFVETEKHGENYYGTEWNALKNEETIPCAILEPKGAKNLKEILKKEGWNAYTVWVDCPIDVAIERIRTRDAEDPVALEKRLNLMNTVEIEWAGYMKYDLKIDGLDSIDNNITKIKGIKKNSRKNKKRP